MLLLNVKQIYYVCALMFCFQKRKKKMVCLLIFVWVNQRSVSNKNSNEINYILLIFS